MRPPAEALVRLLAILDRMEIPYAVTGSVASSAHGIPRTTLDIDLVVDMEANQIDDFAAALQADFYADALLIRQAFARVRAANLFICRPPGNSIFSPCNAMNSAGWNSDDAPIGKSRRMVASPSNAP